MTAACRRNKAKVLMPENANIPLDDEDILDLTVVAEPGSQQTAPLDGPPEPSGPGADFGVDLDALLDSLGADAAEHSPQPSPAPATPAVPESPASPIAAPIADQTPVDHTVDPDEEMALPEMSDIDSLLAELGAEPPASPVAAEADEIPAVAAAPAQQPASSVPMAEFDGLLALAQAAEAQKAEEEEAVAAPEAIPEPVAAPRGAPDADDGEDLDLNELDALLDDILATAPEMSAPASEPPTAAPGLEAAAEVHGPGQAAASPLPADAAAIPVPDQALMPAPSVDPAALSALESRLQKLEESVEILETEELPESMIDGLIDVKLGAKLEELLAENSPVITRIVNEVRGQIAEGTLDFSEQFTVNLEKMAAAAAAKVIREEIAGALQEMEGGHE